MTDEPSGPKSQKSPRMQAWRVAVLLATWCGVSLLFLYLVTSSGEQGSRTNLSPVIYLFASLIAAPALFYSLRSSAFFQQKPGAAVATSLAGAAAFSMAFVVAGLAYERTGAKVNFAVSLRDETGRIIEDAKGTIRLSAVERYSATFSDGQANFAPMPADVDGQSFNYVLIDSDYEVTSPSMTLVVTADKVYPIDVRPKGLGVEPEQPPEAEESPAGKLPDATAEIHRVDTGGGAKDSGGAEGQGTITLKCFTEESTWEKVRPLESLKETGNHHCSHDCRGEPTRTAYSIQLESEKVREEPENFRLENARLNCISGPCGWSAVTGGARVKGAVVSASFDVWSRPMTWKLAADLVERRVTSRVAACGQEFEANVGDVLEFTVPKNVIDPMIEIRNGVQCWREIPLTRRIESPEVSLEEFAEGDNDYVYKLRIRQFC